MAPLTSKKSPTTSPTSQYHPHISQITLVNDGSTIRLPPCGVRRSNDEVRKLIEASAKTKPDWWDKTNLEYPETLDLSFSRPPGGAWNPHRDVSQYMWSVINENPDRYRQGTKLMHYALGLNRGNPQARYQVVSQLGHCYHNLLQDWARAAFWKGQMGVADESLANCYWQLGNRGMAVNILRRFTIDDTKYGSVIKLWSDIGELEIALKLAEESARRQDWAAAYRAAGDACRRHGKYKKAMDYYQKTLATRLRGRLRLTWERNREHARAAIESIRLFEAFDITRVSDGLYRGKCLAYNGELHVSVTVKDHRISEVKVLQHSEKQYYSSLEDIPGRIIKNQDFRNVDATTGATVTAEAIRVATARALAQGVK